MDADVVVIGSGAAGLTAAIVAAQAGLSVLVLESTPLIGGTSAFSGGALWIPDNDHMSGLGLADSPAEAKAYLRALLGNHYDDAKVDAFVEYGPQMLRYMERNSEVQMMPVPTLDYDPTAPGAKTGRTMIAAPYDGARLGAYLRKLRPPIREMAVFGGMQVPHVDIAALRGWNRSSPNFATATRRVLRYGWDRLRHGKAAWLGNGNALVGRLLRTALDSDVTIWTDAPAKRLVMENGRVLGVVCRQGDREQTVRAARGVVLASGGCGANTEMRRRFLPNADAGWSLQPEGSQGDGLNMGEAAGGRIVEDNVENAIWVPVSTVARKDGTLAKFPSIVFDRHYPGFLMIDAATGRRFVNESQSYQYFGVTAARKGVTRAYIIGDHRAVRRYGLGRALPAPFPIRRWVRNGYIQEAKNIAALAGKIGVDQDVLEDTVRRFNAFAERGVDPEFQRGADVFSAANGDPEHRPNPTLRPLVHGPYYALEVRPGDLSVLAGLETNSKAQVVDANGVAIPSLYAAGLDNNTLFRGIYPGGGASLGPAMTFGYVAARQLAAIDT